MTIQEVRTYIHTLLKEDPREKADFQHSPRLSWIHLLGTYLADD